MPQQSQQQQWQRASQQPQDPPHPTAPPSLQQQRQELNPQLSQQQLLVQDEGIGTSGPLEVPAGYGLIPVDATMLQHTSSSVITPTIKERMVMVQSILNEHATKAGQHVGRAGLHAVHSAATAGKQMVVSTERLHERNPDMLIAAVVFVACISALGTCFARTVARMERDAKYRDLINTEMLAVLSQQTEEADTDVHFDVDSTKVEAADDWELRQMIEENEWKRKFACSKREAPGFEDEGDSGDQDKLKTDRKEHLKDMQASLSKLKEKLRAGIKEKLVPGKANKRETRAVRKDK
mmetsp:Transcript_10715/g.26274  ORF Transcript_10715/g.26274 Transcript_10715/m.26274 type:complete len:294 (+) Transcript_10715:1238-2119(+)